MTCMLKDGLYGQGANTPTCCFDKMPCSSLALQAYPHSFAVTLHSGSIQRAMNPYCACPSLCQHGSELTDCTDSSPSSLQVRCTYLQRIQDILGATAIYGTVGRNWSLQKGMASCECCLTT